LRANLDRFPGLDLVIYGIVLILVMVYYPGGFAALVTALRGQRFRLFRLVGLPDFLR
jgi:hypothetical protein